MENCPGRPAPPLIASAPSGILRTGVSAFDERHGGGARGELIVITSGHRDHLDTLSAHAVRAGLEAGCRVAFADFGGESARGALRRVVQADNDAVRSLPQAVPVKELSQRISSWRADPALEFLVVPDLRAIRSPAKLALQALKILAGRERMLVIVATLHGPRGNGLAAFGELPDHADVLMHVTPQRGGTMFSSAHHLSIVKARPFEPVSMPVRWDHDLGLVHVQASA